MNPNPSGSEKMVRARHRAARSVPPLLFAAGGLAVTLALVWLAHPTLLPVQSWRNLGALWLAGLGLTMLGAAAFWQLRKRSLLHSAAEMDAALATHNRLETATALQAAEHPMARAQREETERFLQSARLAPRRGGVTLLFLCSSLLALAHVATLVCWSRPLPPDRAARHAAPAAARTPDGSPTASIAWQSPEPEAAATAIEEVPLVAEADSSTGLRDVTLEVEVNGGHKLSQPLPDDLSQPGEHTLKPSIYLDQLDVKTYDIVSYHLRARRIAGVRLPETVSPVQFVQIKPMREDTFICAGGDQPSKCFNYVTALKAAQLRLMKENFALAHAEISTASDAWREENSRVGGDQNQLADKTGDVIHLMDEYHYPPPILELVRQAQPLMTEAGAGIVKAENEPALAPQGKALNRLTEVERYLKSSIKLAGQSKQAKAADPFQKRKNLDLKTHPLTRAGKVDALAKAQEQLAGDLASGNTNSTLKLVSETAQPDADPIAGAPGERQAEIKARIEEMLEDPAFKDDALKHMQASDDLAGQAQDQIAHQDLAAASEPAAGAARELRQTAAALRADDGQAVKNKLADALLRLSAAANAARQAPRAKSDAAAVARLQQSADAVHAAMRQLEEESRRQQANGAATTAARLAEMARLLGDGSLQQLQAQARQSPRDAGSAGQLADRLDELARRTAQMSHPGQPTHQEIAGLVERMQRTQANLNHLASQCSSPGAAASGQASGQSSASNAAADPARGPEPGRAEQRRQLGEDLKHELSEEMLDAMGIQPDAASLKTMRDALGGQAGSGAESGNVVAFVAEIDPPLSGVIHWLRQDLAQDQRQYRLTDQDVALAPPVYRAAVADYFEQLSRDYAAKGTAGGPLEP